MKRIVITIALISAFITVALSAEHKKSSSEAKPLESMEGITHYGMPIQEVSKTFRKDDALLKIIYSKTLSDDNMDDYVKRFYDELLRQIEKWLYENKLPSKDMRIIISNCKFCRVGYCKKKNIKELSLSLYIDDKQVKQVAFKHNDIIDKTKYIDMARSAAILFLDRR